MLVRCQNHLEAISDRECAHCAKPICAICVRIAAPGMEVCSIACGDRLVTVAAETAEAEKFDSWPVRVISSIFIFLLLTLFGALAASWASARIRPDSLAQVLPLTKEQIQTFVECCVAIGAVSGAASAISYLYHHYTRRRDRRQ